jgi:hypothetical protein
MKKAELLSEDQRILVGVSKIFNSKENTFGAKRKSALKIKMRAQRGEIGWHRGNSFLCILFFLFLWG